MSEASPKTLREKHQLIFKINILCHRLQSMKIGSIFQSQPRKFFRLRKKCICTRNSFVNGVSLFMVSQFWSNYHCLSFSLVSIGDSCSYSHVLTGNSLELAQFVNSSHYEVKIILEFLFEPFCRLTHTQGNRNKVCPKKVD